MKKNKTTTSSEEDFLEFREVETSVLEVSCYTEDHRFQMKVYETVELLQEICPYTQAESTMRRLIAQYGEAYFFFNKTGGLCFLTDFAKPSSKE